MNSTVLKMETPAGSWRDALPCGNGVLGALVYGRVAGERILFNHEALWSQGNNPPVPETADRLDELRTLLAAGQFTEAEVFFPSLWEADGFHAEMAHCLPGPDLCMTSLPAHPFEDYLAQLDMQTGEVQVSWRENGFRSSRRILVSKACGLAVVQLDTGNPDGLNVLLELKPHDPLDSFEYAGFGGVSGFESKTETENRLIRLDVTFADGTAYLAELQVHGATVEKEANGLRVKGAGSATLLFRMVPQNDSLQAVLSDWPQTVCYADLLAEQAARHSALMNRVSFSLGAEGELSNERMLLDTNGGGVSAELAEKLFCYGRYLLVCSSTGEAAYPAHLQGIWNGDYIPAWTGGLFIDENIEMNYWPALPGNLSESMLPLFNVFESVLEDCRENAQRMYNCRGILLPLFMSPRSGRKHNPQPHCVYWTAGGGWIAQHFFDYYLYTGDETFLKERALPFMLEVAQFYEDFFVEGPDGFWVSSPSMSPENTPLGDFDGSGTFRVCVNATMDFAVARELFHNLISTTEVTGLHADDVTRWKTFLGKIPPYQLNEDGSITEWTDDRLHDNDHHRHQSHIYPLFPGREVTRAKNPKLFEACRKAVEKRRLIGIQDQSGWSLAHMASIYARLDEGERALECIRHLTRSCLGKNFFTYHNSDLDMGITQPLIHRMPSPFQIDANFGITAAILEMLLFSCPGEIHLLPALPGVWPTGRIRGMCAMGGIQVGMEWTEDEVSASFTAARSQSCHVFLKDQKQVIKLSDEAPVVVKFKRS